MATAQATAGASLKRKVRRKSRALPIIVVTALIAGGGYWGWKRAHPTENANANLLTAPVTKGDLLESVSATGSVTAQTGAQVKIGSQITGTIKHLYADIGTHVKAGAVIAELDLPDLQAQVAQSRANLGQAQASVVQAQLKLQQQQSGVGMQRTATSSAVSDAQAALRAAQARLNSTKAVAQQQSAQTPQDVKRAETQLGVANAALSTSQSNLKQTQASINLQISTAQEDLKQAQANANNSSTFLKRQQDLVKQGFVAQSLVDQAQAQASVDQSKVSSAQQNIQLVRAKVAADLQTAKDQVTQAQQNVAAAQAALTAAQSGTFTVSARQADVLNAQAAVNQAQASLQTALGNTSQNTLKDQDVQQAQQAIQLAQQAAKVAQSQVDYYIAQLDKTFIRSPISGTVLQLASQQGETLAAGLSAPTLIIVADLNRLQVDAYVDETDIGKIKLGQEADITVDAFPKNPIKGHVAKIASGSTIQQGVITYDVTLSIDKNQPRPDANPSTGGDAKGAGAKNDTAAGSATPSEGTAPAAAPAGDAPGAAPDGGHRRGAGGQGGAGGRRMNPAKMLKPDMTASVTITTGKRTNVLLVPAEAVKMGSRGATVNVLKKTDGKSEVVAVKVKTGGSDGVNTEIREGVNEGDIIVRAGFQDPNKKKPGGPSSPFGPSGGGGGGGRRGG